MCFHNLRLISFAALCLDCEIYFPAIIEKCTHTTTNKKTVLHQPGTKRWQGADFSILTALKITKPGAKSLFDLGVRSKPCSDTTHNMIAAFDSMLDGTIFDVSQASSDDLATSEQNSFGDECHL